MPDAACIVYAMTGKSQKAPPPNKLITGKNTSPKCVGQTSRPHGHAQAQEKVITYCTEQYRQGGL